MMCIQGRRAGDLSVIAAARSHHQKLSDYRSCIRSLDPTAIGRLWMDILGYFFGSTELPGACTFRSGCFRFPVSSISSSSSPCMTPHDSGTLQHQVFCTEIYLYSCMLNNVETSLNRDWPGAVICTIRKAALYHVTLGLYTNCSSHSTQEQA